jgi:adenylate cyclase
MERLLLEIHNEIFGDGLRTDVVNAISTNKDLFIISRATTRAYRGSKLSSAEIAGELGVNYWLSGRLTTSNGPIRVSYELSDAKDIASN